MEHHNTLYCGVFYFYYFNGKSLTARRMRPLVLEMNKEPREATLSKVEKIVNK
jgi:hypothetical protein